MQRKTFVFDWNGTLLADTVYAWQATNEALKTLELPPVSLARYRDSFRVPLVHMYEELGCPAKKFLELGPEFQNNWTSTYNNLSATARLRRGARDLLHQLQENKHDTVILSNYTAEYIGQQAKRLGIHDRFNTILANEDCCACVRQGKADKLKNYLAGIGSVEGIVLGDSEEEAEIARAHGFVAILIANGFCSTRRLRAARPDYIVNSLAEVPAILREKGWLR